MSLNDVKDKFLARSNMSNCEASDFVLVYEDRTVVGENDDLSNKQVYLAFFETMLVLVGSVVLFNYVNERLNLGGKSDGAGSQSGCSSVKELVVFGAKEFRINLVIFVCPVSSVGLETSLTSLSGKIVSARNFELKILAHSYSSGMLRFPWGLLDIRELPKLFPSKINFFHSADTCFALNGNLLRVLFEGRIDVEQFILDNPNEGLLCRTAINSLLSRVCELMGKPRIQIQPNECNYYLGAWQWPHGNGTDLQFGETFHFGMYIAICPALFTKLEAPLKDEKTCGPDEFEFLGKVCETASAITVGESFAQYRKLLEAVAVFTEKFPKLSYSHNSASEVFAEIFNNLSVTAKTALRKHIQHCFLGTIMPDALNEGLNCLLVRIRNVTKSPDRNMKEKTVETLLKFRTSKVFIGDNMNAIPEGSDRKWINAFGSRKCREEVLKVVHDSFDKPVIDCFYRLQLWFFCYLRNHLGATTCIGPWSGALEPLAFLGIEVYRCEPASGKDRIRKWSQAIGLAFHCGNDEKMINDLNLD
jgi:hypothetical protein